MEKQQHYKDKYIKATDISDVYEHLIERQVAASNFESSIELNGYKLEVKLTKLEPEVKEQV